MSPAGRIVQLTVAAPTIATCTDELESLKHLNPQTVSVCKSMACLSARKQSRLAVDASGGSQTGMQEHNLAIQA